MNRTNSLTRSASLARCAFVAAMLAAASHCPALQPKPETAPPASAQTPDLSQGKSDFDPSAPAALEVKKVKTGHLLVRPVINGKPAGWFIFDTGAGICVVNTARKDDLQLAHAGDLDALGVGGATKTRLYRAKTLTLGPVTLHNHPVMLTDLSFLAPHLGEDISGVIGYGVLSRCIAEFSIADASIALHDAQTYSLPSGEWNEMKIVNRIPRIQANVEGRDGLFRIDTGANSGITLHEPTVRKWSMLDNRESTDAKLGGVGGFVKSKRTTLRDVTLGGVKHENVRAELALEAKGTFAESSIDGTIGADLLRHYTLVLDYANERIGLRPRASSPKP